MNDGRILVIFMNDGRTTDVLRMYFTTISVEFVDAGSIGRRELNQTYDDADGYLPFQSDMLRMEWLPFS